MPKSLVVGNGNILATFDQKMFLRDFYFPRVGQEDQTTYGHKHRIGLYVDGAMHWLDSDEWVTTIEYMHETLVGNARCVNEKIGMEVQIIDFVHPHSDVFIRKFVIKNKHSICRKFRMFFTQDFHLYGGLKVQDTAYYEPMTNSVIHYKGKRYFLVSGMNKGQGPTTFTTGKSQYGGFEGTWRDAEDGSLQRNTIVQGSVDSTIGFDLEACEYGEEVLYYWVCCGRTYTEVESLHHLMCKENPDKVLEKTKIYWQSWVNKECKDFADLPESVITLYKRSLLIVRSQIDNRGAIVAANDSDIMEFNNDTYTYMWPRDGAFVAHALDRAGYGEITKRFFRFCANVITAEGYLLHKYNPDGSLGSSWHPWFRDNARQLPIQEDETALVIWSIWNHYLRSKDVEFLTEMYETFVKKAAGFLVRHRDRETNLPLPSYDLWEERFGIFTFTCATTIAGLEAAGNIAKLMGEEHASFTYFEKAATMKEAMLKHLWSDELGRFYKCLVIHHDGTVSPDTTVESSTIAVALLGILPPHDERVAKNMQAYHDHLSVKTEVGGFARFERDFYHKKFHDDEFSKIPGNPWVITTLWYAQYEIMRAKSLKELQAAERYIHWVELRVNETGIMAEQYDPYTAKPLSVAPLTWSHSTFIETVLMYVERYRELDKVNV